MLVGKVLKVLEGLTVQQGNKVPKELLD